MVALKIIIKDIGIAILIFVIVGGIVLRKLDLLHYSSNWCDYEHPVEREVPCGQAIFIGSLLVEKPIVFIPTYAKPEYIDEMGPPPVICSDDSC